jgi:hypothetical protein
MLPNAGKADQFPGGIDIPEMDCSAETRRMLLTGPRLSVCSLVGGILVSTIVLSTVRTVGAQEADDNTVRGALESAATLLRSGRDREALEALGPVEAVEPENPWLLFYRGSAQLHLGNFYESMKDFDEALTVLAGMGDPDPELAEKIRRHRREARRQVFSISYQTGLAYDTNVSYLGAGVSGIDLISGRPDGVFGSLFRIDYAPVATEREALAVGVRLGHTWHFSIEQFDYQDYGGTLRYSRKLNDHWVAALQYDYDVTYLGNEPFLSDHGISPSLTYHWQSADGAFRPDETTVYYRIDSQDFLYPVSSEFDRDGFANGVGVEQSFRFRPVADWNWTWDLRGGYRFESFATEGTEFDRLAHNYYVGLGIPLPNPVLPARDMTFRFTAQWQAADYREKSLIDREHDRRHDEIRVLGWSLSEPLIEDPNWGDLTLHTLINWTDSDSSIDTEDHARPFTYDKVVYGFQLEWSW